MKLLPSHVFTGNSFHIFYRMLIVCCCSDSDFPIQWSDEFWEALQKQRVLASCSKTPPWVWREGGANEKEKLKALLWQATVWQRSKHQREVTFTYCSRLVALFLFGVFPRLASGWRRGKAARQPWSLGLLFWLQPFAESGKALVLKTLSQFSACDLYINVLLFDSHLRIYICYIYN